MDLFKCNYCGKTISSSGKKTFNFITCEHCQKENQLAANNLFVYNILPIICVGLFVGISILLIPQNDIVIKCLVIVGGSFLLHRLICLLLIKNHIFKYHKREKIKE